MEVEVEGEVEVEVEVEVPPREVEILLAEGAAEPNRPEGKGM